MSSSTPSLGGTTAQQNIAVLAVIAAAMAMGASPIFVRLADVGPLTSAFWRVCLALPVLALWARLEPPPAGRRPPSRRAWAAVVLAGALFAGDLTFWHLAIMNTTVANATFMATLAPIWVVLGSGLLLAEPVGRGVVLGLGLCIVGGLGLTGESLQIGGTRVLGDVYGLVTSMFFGAYILAMRLTRRAFSAGRAIFLSSLVTAPILALAAALVEQNFWPAGWAGLAALLALGIVSHAGGQGLLAWALGFLAAAFSSLVIFIEAVTAAWLGWMVLGERLTVLQLMSGVLIFSGILVARRDGSRSS